MKHLNKLIIAVVLLAGLFSQAQDANNPWSLSFGANAVDTRVSAASTLQDQFSNYFGRRLSCVQRISRVSGMLETFDGKLPR